MATRITKALQAKLDSAFGAGSAQVFCAEFSEWRRVGKHVLFGRDGPYRKPKLRDDGALMHVHLIPSLQKWEADRWMRLWKQGRPASQRTSDQALVYAENNAGDYLLIAILDEPGAHAVSDMRTPENKAVMEGFAAVADAFRYDGSVIA